MTSQHTNTTREQKPVSQHAFVRCALDRVALRALADEIENQSEAIVLLYGVTPKAKESFVIIEAMPAIPPDLVSRFQSDPTIVDFVVYDAPLPPWKENDEGPIQAIIDPNYQVETDPLPPPPLPDAYISRGKAIPLSTSHDCYWIVRAWSAGESEGWLLLNEIGEVCEFFTLEESMTLLYTFLAQAASDLLPKCEPDYLALHARGVALVHAHLWAVQLEVMRRVFLLHQHQLSNRQGTEAQPQETPASLLTLFEWLDTHHLRIVPDEEMRAFRLVPDESRPEGADDGSFSSRL